AHAPAISPLFLATEAACAHSELVGRRPLIPQQRWESRPRPQGALGPPAPTRSDRRVRRHRVRDPSQAPHYDHLVSAGWKAVPKREHLGLGFPVLQTGDVADGPKGGPFGEGEASPSVIVLRPSPPLQLLGIGLTAQGTREPTRRRRACS